MLNMSTGMTRHRMRLIRNAAIILAFASILHFARRECAKNADLPACNGTPAAVTTVPAGFSRSVTKAEEFHATAYCVSGLTRAGVPVARGHVAADPKVIPLGSVIRIESPFMNGIYQVMDTGSLIKGKIIDIFMPSYEDCIEFGRRSVKVQVLRYGFKGKRPPKEKPAE